MPGYSGFQKKKSGKLATTLLIVALVHVALAGFLWWLSTTEFGQELIRVYKINMSKVQEKPPEPPPPPPEPEPEPPKPEPKPEAPPPPPPAASKPSEPVKADAGRPASPADAGSGFTIGKSRGRYAGYADLLTAAIQQKYRQPHDLPDDIEYMVLCQLVVDEQGRVLAYQLVNSSGSELFDQSALEALSQVAQVRPPPPGMDKTIVVKFFPP
jgi:protein TonB